MKYRYNYISGQKIGELTFLNRVPAIEKNNHPRANFLCECGKEFTCRIESAQEGRTKSCGCKPKSLPKYKPAEYESNGLLKIPEIGDKVIARFWGKVGITANPNLCWEWKMSMSKAYAEFRIGRRMYKSHRVAYFIHNKEPLGELDVLHSCDNPKCCNPAHLSLGTHYDNMQDMKQKGRAKNGSTNNLQLTKYQ